MGLMTRTLQPFPKRTSVRTAHTYGFIQGFATGITVIVVAISCWIWINT